MADNFVEMTEEENAAFEAALADPAVIETHDKAREIIDVLDYEIASIEASLETARIEATFAPLSEQKMNWVHRAAMAASIKKGQRHKIYQRDKEIRGVFRKQVSKEPGEGIAKHARFEAEAQERKAAKQAQAAKAQLAIAQIAAAKDWRKRFVGIVQGLLTKEQFDSAVALAKKENSAGCEG